MPKPIETRVRAMSGTPHLERKIPFLEPSFRGDENAALQRAASAIRHHDPLWNVSVSGHMRIVQWRKMRVSNEPKSYRRVRAVN